jgi:uncharacterized YccA/Bax inhibitor family protein
MRSGNPALRGDVFTSAPAFDDTATMTIQGTVNKTLFLLALTLIGAAVTWHDPVSWSPFTIFLVIGGLVIALVTIFKKQWAGVTSPLYAAIEGLVLGVVSVSFERRFPGIAVQAVALTFGTLFCLLVAYKSRLIAATENFKLGVTAATGAVALVYLVDLGLRFFGKSVPMIHQGGTVGIVFSAVVVVIAALNLVMDFDFIERGEQERAPKYMEWYGAFGLMVTLIWLYLEILRLLAKSRRR